MTMVWRIGLTGLLVIATALLVPGQPGVGEALETVTIARGSLSALFRDNSNSPRILSGVESLFHLRDAPQFDAFDPDGPGGSAGLNFEHIISGHSDTRNRFAPRHGRYSLYPLTDGNSVVLVRRKEDCPWSVSSTLRYSVTAPHYLDIEFKATAHDRSQFGSRGYALFFFANYMNDVSEVPLRFLGVNQPSGEEQWLEADAPRGHPDWNSGGTYRHSRADELRYDDDHNFKLNLWSYDYPRYTKPFYYGLAANGMVFQIMFDRAHAQRDEIRFSLFKFKLPRKPRPAWDFQYVIYNVEEGKEYGFKARVIWKKFVSARDCLEEYETWADVVGTSYN